MRLPPLLQKWKLEDGPGRTNGLETAGEANPPVVETREVAGNAELDGNANVLRGKGMANELVGKRRAELPNCEKLRDRAKGEVLNGEKAKGTRCMNGDVLKRFMNGDVLKRFMNGDVLKRGLKFIIIGLANPPRVLN